MKILVLGATGGTGREVVRQALDADHEVIAFVRHPEALQPSPGLSIVRGSLEDEAGMAAALAEVDVVVSCIGPRDPLDFLRGNLMQRTFRTVMSAMKAAGVQRLVLMSAIGVGDTESFTPASLVVPIRTVMRRVYADKEKAESLLADSGLDVRTVYPVILTSGPATGTAQLLPISPDLHIGAVPTVARSDVATLLLELALAENPADRRFVITG